jgi:hypothetical protein
MIWALTEISQKAAGSIAKTEHRWVPQRVRRLSHDKLWKDLVNPFDNVTIKRKQWLVGDD